MRVERCSTFIELELGPRVLKPPRGERDIRIYRNKNSEGVLPNLPEDQDMATKGPSLGYLSFKTVN